MYKKLRIICSIVAALLTAACPFIFLYAGNNWGICSIGGILVFFFMMLTFKKLQEEKEGVKEDKPQVGDYITGKVPLEDSEEEETETPTEPKE